LYPFFNASFFITVPLRILCSNLIHFDNQMVTGRTSHIERINRTAISNKTAERQTPF
jgi:hypothetical protein